MLTKYLFEPFPGIGSIFLFLLIMFIFWFFENIKKRSIEKCYKEYEKFLDYWLSHIEPKYRFEKGYPFDWQARRQYIINRDGRKCQQCGRELHLNFKPTKNWENALLTREEQDRNSYGLVSRNAEAHIHHKRLISEGGDYSLDNLILLCKRCHSFQKGHELLVLY